MGMKLSAVLPLAAVALDLPAAVVGNPVASAMRAFGERYLDGHSVHSFIRQDTDDDTSDGEGGPDGTMLACAREMGLIYDDWTFIMTVMKIQFTCPATVDFTNTTFSLTNDYTECDEEDAFETACADLEGVVLDVPEIYVGCTLDYDGVSYTSSYGMIGAKECLGSSCTKEYDDATLYAAEDAMEADMDAQMEKYLELFGMEEGSVECTVNFGGSATEASADVTTAVPSLRGVASEK